jgi:hypothetical protein
MTTSPQRRREIIDASAVERPLKEASTPSPTGWARAYEQ